MRILIIEDEVPLAEALAQILLKEKYTVDTVYDGASGLDYALSGIYDLIILDWMLPKMNGLDVLKNLRKEKYTLPILLLTAKDETDDKVSGLDCGADDYLTKPFATSELLARIRALSRRRGEISDNTLRFSDITLNLKTGELSCGEYTLKLGLKEFQITEMLLANGKQIISKERFIEKIWGFDGDAEYNNVEVYISFIRKKLAHLHSKVEIKTARGLGYYMEESHD